MVKVHIFVVLKGINHNIKTNIMKIFKLVCNDFGHKFSFNAKDEQDAKDKLYYYEAYHSMHGAHTVEETQEEKWMLNEYVN